MKKIVILSAILAATFATGPAFAGPSLTFRLQNLSTGQSIMACPLYAVGPCNTASLFKPGQIATVPVEMMAEGSIASTLIPWFTSRGWRVVLGQGEVYARQVQTVTIPLPGLGVGQFMCGVVIAKLRQTNDTFVGIENTPVQASYLNRWLDAKSYDAGTEVNTEKCADMPAGTGACPTMGQGFNPVRAPNEIMITPSPGLHGSGDMLLKHNNFNTERPARVLLLLNQ